MRIPGTERLSLPRVIDLYDPERTFTNRLANIVDQPPKLAWAAGSHTTMPMLIMSMGPREYASRVQGHGHDTRVAHIIFAALTGE